MVSLLLNEWISMCGPRPSSSSLAWGTSEMQAVGSSDPLNQKLGWAWAAVWVSTRPPGDSDVGVWGQLG